MHESLPLDYVERGLMQPVSVRHDYVVVTLTSLAVAIAYAALRKRHIAGVKDLVVLATGVAISWYGSRFILFGVRWGVNSTFHMVDPIAKALVPAKQFAPCPGENPMACDLQYCHADKEGVFGTAKNLMASATAHEHFSTITHYFDTFVLHKPGTIFAHLIFITCAGVLWPLQVWAGFRTASYKRHRIIGRITMLLWLGAMLTAAVLAVHHMAADNLADKVTGVGFGVQIAAVLYSLVAGYRAARRRDIPTHQKHVIRMIGLAYGVFPFKQIFAALPFLNYMPGKWTYATSVWLSSVTAMILTERALLGLHPEDEKHLHSD